MEGRAKAKAGRRQSDRKLPGNRSLTAEVQASKQCRQQNGRCVGRQTDRVTKERATTHHCSIGRHSSPAIMIIPMGPIVDSDGSRCVTRRKHGGMAMAMVVCSTVTMTMPMTKGLVLVTADVPVGRRPGIVIRWIIRLRRTISNPSMAMATATKAKGI